MSAVSVPDARLSRALELVSIALGAPESRAQGEARGPRRPGGARCSRVPGRVLVCLVLAPLVLVGVTHSEPSKPVVAEVKVEGGATISPETVEYYLGVTEGEPFDPDAISGSFHRFWDSGLVEELTVFSEEIEPGKVRVIVAVRERPKVVEWDFSGNKKLSTSTIREKLETANITLKRNTPLRASEVQRIKRGIQEAYAKEGYASATVEAVIEETGPSLRKVTLRVDEGVKIRIGEIRFEGNQVFSDRRLRRALKKVKERSLIRPFGKKLIWSKESWGEDSENLKKFYMNHGYKDVVVGEPKVDLVARNPGATTQKKRSYRMIISIPVQEGGKFRLGSIKVTGSTVFTEAQLRKLYYVKPGKTYNFGQIDAGNETVRNLYQSRGYIYAYTNQVLLDNKEQADLTDVVINVYEGDRFRLGRVEFSGNTKTQDKVLRREFRLFEGAWMDMGTFKRSVFKMNQLGYFKLTDDPLTFDFDDEHKLVNVTIKGDEVGRTDVQFGAGYSELDHFFAQFMFNTRNFLGRGEILGVAVSSGTRADSYSLSFSEPYFLDKRQMIGASVYNQRQELVDYVRKQKGATLAWGVGYGDFGNFAVVYGWEDVFAKYSVVRRGEAGQEPSVPHRRPLPPPYKGIPDAAKFFDIFRGITSSFTPSVSYDSRDDPFDPNQGVSYFVRVRIAGGPLGGDFNYVRPEIGGTYFHPLSRKTIFAGNFESGIIIPFSGSLVPIYDRYRLGGERSLRGFQYLEVLPRKSNGDYFYNSAGVRLGGDRYVQLNLEYQIKLGGPIKLIIFLDTGNTYFEDQGWNLTKLRYSSGAELRIFLPVFQAPLRFIYGINLDPYKAYPLLGIPAEKRGDFQFSIGTTF